MSDERSERNEGGEEHLVIFHDEEGNPYEMLVVYSFQTNDGTYAVLLEKDRPEEDGVIMKVEEGPDETYLVNIEDDEEWDRVVAVYNELLANEDN